MVTRYLADMECLILDKLVFTFPGSSPTLKLTFILSKGILLVPPRRVKTAWAKPSHFDKRGNLKCGMGLK